ncbi:MAG: aminoacyl-histidine dipeptidase [Acidobacteriota bacterium]|nr:aminoacyl-histidine dipeptidase [Acidobacteriota bacterium]
MSFVESFEPKAVWRHFDEILAVPRASKDEEAIRRHVVAKADAAGLEHQVDKAGNVVIRKPGTAGHEDSPPTILQAHLDMVQEKNSDVDFDFATDAIKPVQDGEYLTADGTTLGSDNGIGVAASLAVMEADDLVHGPLEFLFTVDEETGLTGASELDESLLIGRRLINMDSEEEGALCVGCAGGADTELLLPIDTDAVPEGSTALALDLAGLKGGHSGVDIHLQRANAIRLLSRFLAKAARETELRLADFAGGSAHNAIPREARAVVVLPVADRPLFEATVTAEYEAARAEFASVDPGLSLSINDANAPAAAWSLESTARSLQLLDTLPHGVLGMSYDIPGLVETSTNLATVKSTGDELSIKLSTRSSVDSALEALRGRIHSAGLLAGATIIEEDGYPGWKPDMSSELLTVLKALSEDVYGHAPEVGAIHAGLECGIIGEKCPGMDMISFGPQIEFPHSPDERVKIDSVGRFWKLLVLTLEKLA